MRLKKHLGAEDFGEFMKHAPGAMFTLGTQKEGHENYLLHHPKFDLDERALPIGTAMLVETAKRFSLAIMIQNRNDKHPVSL